VAGACGRVAGALLVFGGWYQLLHGSTAGLWLIVVGFFVSAAAGAEIRRAALENALRGVPLTEAMSSPVVTAPDWLTAERLVEELPATGGHSVLPLVDFDGRVSGVLAVRRLSAVPAARRGQVRLRELAVPLARCLVAAPGDSLVETLGRAGATLPLLVLDGGRPLGIVTADDLARLVRNPRTTHGAPGPSPTAP
jgi:CBS domain-containing protein